MRLPLRTPSIAAALVAAGALSLAFGCFGSEASAATIPAQLRFSVQPNGSDSVWTSHPGVNFQKYGECVFSDSAVPPTQWPASGKGGGHSTAPLFNPGFATSDYSYSRKGPDDGFNTLFFPDQPVAAQSIVCRGKILANGIDVTLQPNKVVAKSVTDVNQSGPMSVTVKLDNAKIVGPAFTTIPAQLRFSVQPGGGDAAWTSHPGVNFQKYGQCVFSNSPTTGTAWPAAGTGGGHNIAPLFNPGFATPDYSYSRKGPDDGFNTLFFPQQSVVGAQTMICRGTILANGHDVTLNAPGRVASKTTANVNSGGPMSVTVQLDMTKLQAVLTSG